MSTADKPAATTTPKDTPDPSAGAIVPVDTATEIIEKTRALLANGGKDAEVAQGSLVAAWSDITQNLLGVQASLQSDGPKDQDALNKQIANLTKQKTALEEFMHANQISLPSSSLADAFKGVAWAEVYQTVYLILHACDLCFEILKYQPIADDFADSPTVTVTQEEEKKIEDEIEAEARKKKAEQDAEDKRIAEENEARRKATEAASGSGSGSAPGEPAAPAGGADKPAAPVGGADKPAAPAAGVDKPAAPAAKPAAKPAAATPIVDASVIQKTWDDLRDGIILVLKTSKPQLDNLFSVVDSVARLGRRFKEFLEFIPTEAEYQRAPSHLKHVRDELVVLGKLSVKLQEDTGKYFSTVVDKSSVLLKQAGQEYLQTNADTVVEGEAELATLETQLMALYTPEIGTRDLISMKEGELAGLKLRRELAVQRVKDLQTMYATVSEQIELRRKSSDDKAVEWSKHLEELSQKVSKSEEDSGKIQQERIDEAEKARKQAQDQADAELSELKSKLSKIPATLEQKKTVSNSGFLGIGSSSSTEITYVANPEYDFVQKRINNLESTKTQSVESAVKLSMTLAESKNAIDKEWIQHQRDELSRLGQDQDKLKAYLAGVTAELEQQLKQITSDLVELNGTSALPSSGNTPTDKPADKPADADAVPAGSGIIAQTALIPQLEQNIVTAESSLTVLKETRDKMHKNLEAREEKIRASMEDWAKKVEAAKRKRDIVIGKYGMVGSQSAVKSTYDLLSKLLSLPRTIDGNTDHFLRFRSQVDKLITEVTTGLYDMETGANALPPFGDDLDGTCNWLIAIRQPNAAKKVQEAGFDKSIFQEAKIEEIAPMLNFTKAEEFAIKIKLKDYLNNNYPEGTYFPQEKKRSFENGLRTVAAQLLELGVVVEVLTPNLKSIRDSRADPTLKKLTAQ